MSIPFKLLEAKGLGVLDYPAAAIPPAQPSAELQGLWWLSRREEVAGSSNGMWSLNCTSSTRHIGQVTKLFPEQQAEKGNGSLDSAQYMLCAGWIFIVL